MLTIERLARSLAMTRRSDIERWRDLNASTERLSRQAKFRVAASLRFSMLHFSYRAHRATSSACRFAANYFDALFSCTALDFALAISNARTQV